MAISQILDNYQRVLARIQTAAIQAGRKPEEIKLVAVSKTVPVAIVQEAVSNGITLLGENRVQEAKQKFEVIGNNATWHLVGHLQSNKVKPAVSMFELIQSVDSIELAKEISNRAQQINKVQNILIEINTSGEETKFGIEPAGLIPMLEQISLLSNIRIQGLMTVGPLVPEPELARPSFIQLRELSEKVKSAGLANIEMHILSMGMTGDFEIAIQEGANMLRIGTAIFGHRNI
ncbi:MAG: YggS family pyridoxal phosphate-dependent enzyme [bacterium]